MSDSSTPPPLPSRRAFLAAAAAVLGTGLTIAGKLQPQLQVVEPPFRPSDFAKSRSAGPMAEQRRAGRAGDAGPRGSRQSIAANRLAATPASSLKAGGASTAPSLSQAELAKTLFPDFHGNVAATAEDAPVLIEKRSLWTAQGPRLNMIQPMDGVDRITVHHSGFQYAFEEDAWKATAAEVENIRCFHVKDRKWADIAYHFVVDRAGRVWQGRPLIYEGAHVHNHNQHNLGIVLLGNFDLQRPSAAQATALLDFVTFLRTVYPVRVSNIRTHGELADNKTDCPGTQLQRYISRIRSRWA